jgi:hypothetical protein
VLRQASEATSADQLKKIGTQAREDGLLDVEVHGATVQVHLLNRINDIAEARKAQRDEAAAGAQ